MTVFFYFNGDKFAVERSSLENKYFIENLSSCIGPLHKEMVNKIFEEKIELFDNLTNDDSFYILLGALAGSIGSRLLGKMTELLEKKEKRDSFPFLSPLSQIYAFF